MFSTSIQSIIYTPAVIKLIFGPFSVTDKNLFAKVINIRDMLCVYEKSVDFIQTD